MLAAEGVISVSQYVCCSIEVFLPGADCQMLRLWIEVVQCLDGPSIKDDCVWCWILEPHVYI